MNDIISVLQFLSNISKESIINETLHRNANEKSPEDRTRGK